METQKIDQLAKKLDSTLLDEVKSLVRREKEIVVEVIQYLKEIERRRLHLERGYSSMFAFATVFLGYSEAEAHIRIQAARLTQSIPEATQFIESGELSLSVAASAQSHFRKENLRRKELGKPVLNIQEKREVLELVTGASRREAEHSLNIHFSQQSTKKLQFEAAPELMAKIERLMNLMAHKNFDRDLGRMVEILVDAELERYEHKNGQSWTLKELEKPSLDQRITTTEVAKANESNQQTLGNLMIDTKGISKRNRYIPRKTRTRVWANYKGECTYQDPLTGRKCQTKHGIQIDHKIAFSKGGTHSAENLTLLCASHNAWKGFRQVE